MPKKLALKLESLNQPLRPALALAAGLGLHGVQVDAVGDLGPDALSETGRKDVRHRLRSGNLELAALGCPLRHGFDVESGLDARVAHVKKVLTLAYELGCRLVVTYPGPIPATASIPEKPNPPQLVLPGACRAEGSDAVLVDALTDLARHGDRVGAMLVLETGRETPASVAAFLDRLPSGGLGDAGDLGGLGLAVDPASLLGHGHDPAEAVRAWRQRLAYVYARDARPGRPDRDVEEVPLGHGDVDWLAFLGALEEIGYRAWLTIKRGPCADPVSETRAAVAFLGRLAG